MVMIAATAVGKSIPILGSVVDAHEAVFSTIEMNRIKTTFAEVFHRLDQLESGGGPQVFDEKACSVMVYGADQVRNDILADSKAKEYGSAIAHYVKEPGDLNEVFEILDCLRKLSASDLKILYQFRIGGKLFDNREVAKLAGYQAAVNPFGNQSAIRDKMETLYPSLMRLQGLGVIYLSKANSQRELLRIDIGGLSEDLRKSAFLTNSGKRLVGVLPP